MTTETGGGRVNTVPTSTQILMPVPVGEETASFDRERYTKVMGLTIERAKIAEFDAGIKALGWKNRRVWLAACIDTVIEETKSLR
jgi:hypothetical protein